MKTPIKEKLSFLAKKISPSPTLAVDAKAKALKAAGEDVCRFGTGEPDFDTPDFIKEACIKALKEGKTKYTDSAGIPELREALAAKFRDENKISSVQSGHVIVSPGGKFSCFVAIAATCSPGDEVIIPAPYWVSYPEMVKMMNAIPRYIETTDADDFKMTPDQLRDAIMPKTKMLILNSPSNPTGMVYSKEELAAIAEIAVENEIFVLSDEIYEYLLYGDIEHHSIASFGKEIADLTITVGGFSKSYSMTGWRLGTLVASEAVSKAVARIQGHSASNATTFAQYGALAALEQKDLANKAIQEMLIAFNKRRLMLLEGLRSIDGIKCLEGQAAFYLFPRIDAYGMSSTDFASQLLDKEKVALVPGIAFGADPYVRLSYATSESVILDGLERIGRFCKGLNA